MSEEKLNPEDFALEWNDDGTCNVRVKDVIYKNCMITDSNHDLITSGNESVISIPLTMKYTEAENVD